MPPTMPRSSKRRVVASSSVPGEVGNRKITTREDLELAAVLLATKAEDGTTMRSG